MRLIRNSNTHDVHLVALCRPMQGTLKCLSTLRWEPHGLVNWQFLCPFPHFPIRLGQCVMDLIDN